MPSSLEEVLRPLIQQPTDRKTWEKVANQIRLVTTKLPNVTISFFGSTVSGLNVVGSDLDAIVHSPTDKIPHLIQEICRTIKSKDSKFFIKLALPTARIPLIKLVHKSTKLHIDLTFDSPSDRRPQVIQNTTLLSRYSNRPKFRESYLSFKVLFRNTPATTTQLGGLSNYAWAIIFAAVCVNEHCFGLVDTKNYQNVKYHRRVFPRPFTSILLWVLTNIDNGQLFTKSFDIRNKETLSNSKCFIVQDPYENINLAQRLQPDVITLLCHLASHWLNFIDKISDHPSETTLDISKENNRISSVVIPSWKDLKQKGKKRKPYTPKSIGLHCKA